MIRAVDEHIQTAFQNAYTYAWDRWGIYIGTVRLTLITAALMLFQARLPYESPLVRLGTPNQVSLPGLVLMFLVWSILFYLPHGYVQRTLQRKECWKDLFEVSRVYRQQGLRIRMLASSGFVLGVFIGYVWMGHIFEAGNALRLSAAGFVYAYLYSLGVHVYPRDHARFPKRASQAAHAG